jgi:AcrR family transcriptional regulator
VAAAGNAEATKELILAAAMAEFSAYGIAGARVDRIAKTAGCNKNLIYIYFENKETLFTTVLEKHLLRVYQDLTFTPDDLPGYAMRLFDFSMAHPDLMRLMSWSSLEQKPGTVAARNDAHEPKVAALAAAQDAGRLGTGFPPDFLLTTVMVLATAWSALSSFGPSLDPEAANRPAELRKNIGEAVRLITSARGGDDQG